MEENRTVFTDIRQLFATYGIIVCIFIALSPIVGKSTAGYSSLFSLGGQGLSLSTLLQLLMLAAVITAAQIVFLSDRLIRHMPIIPRHVLFFTVIMASIVVMVVLFGWFPVRELSPWIGFLVSYSVSMGISVLVTRLKERAENARMNSALDRYNSRP